MSRLLTAILLALSLAGVSAPASVATAAAAEPSGAGTCEKPGRYTIEADNRGDQIRTSTAPLELTLIIEPPAVDVAALPPAATPNESVEPLVEASEPTRVVGSGSYGDGPVLTDGRYTDTMIPGEEACFRVPLTYGQRLTYRIEVPALAQAPWTCKGSPRVRRRTPTRSAWARRAGAGPRALPLLLALSTAALGVATATAIWLVRRTRRRPGNDV
ncbi:hypothetical protein [Nonomuraea bangladeshensis]|uniref:hypothetical protein n=1 Tax=Nonomuraea bangladeshensis TaxID=404385 RepID=UPI0031CF6B8B